MFRAVQSASLCFCVGEYWLRLTAALLSVLKSKVRVRPITEQTQLDRDMNGVASFIIELTLEGITNPNVADKLRLFYASLLKLLNGNLFLPYLYHFCPGESCCNSASGSLFDRLADIFDQTLLRCKPTVPVVSRWNKLVSSLDFWLLVSVLSNFILDMLEKGVMQDFIGAVFEDGDESDFKAMQGKRIKTGHANFSRPISPAVVCILALLLAPIRIVAKFFQRSIRIARLNRKGMVRPPCLDATNPGRSYVVLAVQLYSALLSIGSGRRILLCNLLRGLEGQSVVCGLPNARRTILSIYRKAIVKCAAAMHWRHIVRYGRWPYLLAASLDDEQPWWYRLDIIRRFLAALECCLGFTLVALRRRLLRLQLEGTAIFDDRQYWATWVHGALLALFDTLDLSTGDVEEMHANQQRLLVNRASGQSYFTFFAKCVNRQAGQLSELGEMRNRKHDTAAPPAAAGRAPNGAPEAGCTANATAGQKEAKKQRGSSWWCEFRSSGVARPSVQRAEETEQ